MTRAVRAALTALSVIACACTGDREPTRRPAAAQPDSIAFTGPTVETKLEGEAVGVLRIGTDHVILRRFAEDGPHTIEVWPLRKP